jgi:hypothetical protein
VDRQACSDMGLARLRKRMRIGFAIARAKFGRGEIRVLKSDRSIEEVIAFDRIKGSVTE